MKAPTVHDVLGMALNYGPLDKDAEMLQRVQGAYDKTLPSKTTAASETYAQGVLFSFVRWLEKRHQKGRRLPMALYQNAKDAIGD